MPHVLRLSHGPYRWPTKSTIAFDRNSSSLENIHLILLILKFVIVIVMFLLIEPWEDATFSSTFVTADTASDSFGRGTRPLARGPLVSGTSAKESLASFFGWGKQWNQDRGTSYAGGNGQ